MKASFWSRDWFAGVAIVIAFLVAQTMGYLGGMDRIAYDLGVKSSDRDPGSQIAIIAIDDRSINNLGRWPWDRDILAQMIDQLSEGQAKVIGNMVLLSEPQIDDGQIYIQELLETFNQSSLRNDLPAELDLLSAMLSDVSSEDETATPDQAFIQQLAEFYASSSLVTRSREELDELGYRLEEAGSALDKDRQLAASVARAGNVVQNMQMTVGEPLGKPDTSPPDYFANSLLFNVNDKGSDIDHWYPIPTLEVILPITAIGEPAAALGHTIQLLDVDGGIRTEPLLVDYYGTFVPSMSLQIAARSLNLVNDDIEVVLGYGIRMGGLDIQTASDFEMYSFFYNDSDLGSAFEVDSFFDVLTGNIPVDKYRDRIVLIGPTASGLGHKLVTPVSAAMDPVLILAHSVASILNEDFFVVPTWAGYAEMGVFALIALYLIVLLPRLRAGVAFSLTGLLVVILGITPVALLATKAIWIKLWLPASLLLFGHALLTTKRFLLTEKGKIRSEAESAESNRMLGLAFQNQGQLDMALEKFNKCPMDDTMTEPFYNLALDYERKRQFNKAVSVYEHIVAYNPKFKDVKDRMDRSKMMEETIMFGAPSGGGNQSTMVLNAGEGVQKPMLGRYEVEKELGKGAMGVVYLGKDPKINRVVAIKTMALSQEFEEDELEEVKERFFREAETAGRLAHPNIVTIYDAGEEHDLAYIAMEFLKGADLAPHTKEGKLLPLPKVMEIITQAADALDYAHKANVVHRDIKPANLMYDPDSGSMKITDFGIARITDSSKTKTGMVLGTPSYMSPEQLSGKKVDGRSDLFSLGVMLYQMISGRLPFIGDSMATLMYRIANEPHLEIFSILPELADTAPCLSSIIDRSLDKNIETRFQSGAEMATELRNCTQQIHV